VIIPGTMDGPGPDYSAQLYLVGANNSLTPLTPISTFNPAGNGAAVVASQFWAPKTVTIDGHFSGETLIFLVRAWQTTSGSYEAALMALGGRGQSDQFAVTLGGASQDPNVPPATPANLTNLRSFSVQVGAFPEPSTIAICFLGAGVLMAFGRLSSRQQ
jgi:hypothetical protein